MKTDPVLLTVLEAASLVGLTVWQIRGLIATRQLPAVKLGRRFYIIRSMFVRWTKTAEGLVGDPDS
jgi:excisionase family DNA binding protein